MDEMLYLMADDFTDCGLMTADPFALDPAIAELCDGPVPAPIDWVTAERLTGCSRELYFAGLANMLVMAGVRLVAGYQQSERRARGARHRAYSAGIVTPPRRRTRAQDRMADAAAFGLVKPRVRPLANGLVEAIAGGEVVGRTYTIEHAAELAGEAVA